MTARKSLLQTFVFPCNTKTVYMMPVVFNPFLTFPEINGQQAWNQMATVTISCASVKAFKTFSELGNTF